MNCNAALSKTFRSFKDVAGFTLVEVLIGISILTIGLLALASMQVSAIRGNAMSDRTTTALALAEAKMEELLLKDFDDPDLRDSNPFNNSDLSSMAKVDHEERGVTEAGDVGGGDFHRIWNVAETSDPPIKTITVIVSWDEDKHRVSFTSCINRQ
ncbi:MAG: prepilin-type N-terminal cleavage/methylation domain-containing protein [Deltaproteobacteria bacterium]|nr:prepilin-type N-terminal cleavage/methylation domain-containing protein [Deltaproteobacteria bacterium]